MAANAYASAQHPAQLHLNSTCLLPRETLRLARHVHPLQPDSNRARADEDDLVPALVQLHHGLDDRGERREQRLVRRLVHDRGRP